jgi:hypothetical protein
MKTKKVYVCEHCSTVFDTPCRQHEVKCLAEKNRVAMIEKAAARVEPLCNVLLGETTDAPIGAKINGMMFLTPAPFTKKIIKAFSGATEMVSTATEPSAHDSVLIKRANEILCA